MNLHVAPSPVLAGATPGAKTPPPAGSLAAQQQHQQYQQAVPLLTPRGGGQAKDWTAALQDAQTKYAARTACQHADGESPGAGRSARQLPGWPALNPGMRASSAFCWMDVCVCACVSAGAGRRTRRATRR